MGKAFVGPIAGGLMPIMVLAALFGMAFTVVSGARNFQVPTAQSDWESATPSRTGFRGGRSLSFSGYTASTSVNEGWCKSQRRVAGLRGSLLVRNAENKQELWPVPETGRFKKANVEAAVLELCLCTTPNPDATTQRDPAAAASWCQHPESTQSIKQGVVNCAACPAEQRSLPSQQIACAAGFAFNAGQPVYLLRGHKLALCLMKMSQTWKRMPGKGTGAKLEVLYGAELATEPEDVGQPGATAAVQPASAASTAGTGTGSTKAAQDMVAKVQQLEKDIKGEKKAVEKAQGALDSAEGKLVRDEKIIDSLKQTVEAAGAAVQPTSKINKSLPPVQTSAAGVTVGAFSSTTKPGEVPKTAPAATADQKWVEAYPKKAAFEGDGGEQGYTTTSQQSRFEGHDGDEDRHGATTQASRFEDDGEEEVGTTHTWQSRFEDNGEEEGGTAQVLQSRFEDDGEEEGYGTSTQRSRFEDHDGDEDEDK